eukprot:NODE_318_length_9930_cov_0.612857.p1 type:complete len:356 gc:universal NODE_318_length_9930_cov_0.612857:2843-3910(+)
MTSLRWLFSNTQIGRLGRWCLRMAIFDFSITKNPADIFSRNFTLDSHLGEGTQHLVSTIVTRSAMSSNLTENTGSNPGPNSNLVRDLSIILQSYGTLPRINGKIALNDQQFQLLFNQIHTLVGHSRVIKQFLLKSFFVPNLRKEVQKNLSQCDICRKARQPQLPKNVELMIFPSCSIVGEQIFPDLKVMPREFTVDEYKVILVIVHQHSRYTWLKVLESFTASELVRVFDEWLQSSTIWIQELRFDAGTNFVSKVFTEWLHRKGAQRIEPVPRSHQTIGLVERQIQEVNRYFRRHPHYLNIWWTRVHIIAQILNLTPRKSLNWNSPLEVLQTSLDNSLNVIEIVDTNTILGSFIS